MRLLSRLIVVLSLAVIGWPAQAAGELTVSFHDPDKFTDFARFPIDVRNRVDELKQVLTSAAERQLQDGQSLDLEILDVDLAGTMAPGPSTVETRVVRSTDWSRMHVRYTFHDGNKAPITGDEWIDSRDRPWHEDGHAFGNEGRMFERWLEKRFEGK